MAATRRLAASVLAVSLGLAGCTYASEPGLFASKPPAPSPFPSRSVLPPEPTNPELPVAGQATWTSAEGLSVTVRYAVHAVRRIPGGSVLDWSVTPLSAPDLEFGAAIPGVMNLGISHPGSTELNVLLIDADRRQTYLPLRHRSRREFNHCLCTPLWLIQQRLRIGETRLMQVTFPELPGDLATVDVSLANLGPFVGVPVSPVGTAPDPREPVDLARMASPAPSATGRLVVPHPTREPTQTIRIDRVLSAPGLTAIEWTIGTTQSRRPRTLPDGPPAVRPAGTDQLLVAGGNPTNGPIIRVGDRTLKTSWIRRNENGLLAYECLCSQLGIWARVLNQSNGSASVTSLLPPLPPGTQLVDIVLPGFRTVPDVPVTLAPDSSANLGPAVPRVSGSWYYTLQEPPSGWATRDWPTDLPDPAQLVDYEPTVSDIVELPGW